MRRHWLVLVVGAIHRSIRFHRPCASPLSRGEADRFPMLALLIRRRSCRLERGFALDFGGVTILPSKERAIVCEV
jgi:hypothetical protein